MLDRAIRGALRAVLRIDAEAIGERIRVLRAEVAELDRLRDFLAARRSGADGSRGAERWAGGAAGPVNGAPLRGRIAMYLADRKRPAKPATIAADMAETSEAVLAALRANRDLFHEDPLGWVSSTARGPAETN